VRNDTRPQQAKVPLYLYARAGVLLYNPVVPDRCTGGPIFRSKCRAEHRDVKSDNIVVISFAARSFVCLCTSRTTERATTCFNYLPVHITSPVNTGTINLHEC
jgi:hypothetical protein